MMRQATWYHTVWASVLVVLLALLGWGAFEVHGGFRAAALVQTLAAAETADVPQIVADLDPYRRWADAPLAQMAAAATAGSKQRLHAQLALVAVDPSQVEPLRQALLNASPEGLLVIRQFLLPYKDRIVKTLWQVVGDTQAKPDQRFRAACALASYDPASPRWARASREVANKLVTENPLVLGKWTEALRPVRGVLSKPLGEICRDAKRPESERSLAANVLTDYGADQPEVLADLLMDVQERQFAVLFPKVEAHREGVLAVFLKGLAVPLDSKETEDQKEYLAKRQANAAVALLRLGRSAEVWPLLKHTPDPRVRSYLIHRLSPLRANPTALVKQLDEKQEVSIRRALLLSLGEFGPDQLSPSERAPLIPQIAQLYREDPDRGIHGAAEWLLGKWGQKEKLKKIDKELATGKVKGQRQWYINRQGQTLAVVPGPVEFWMGSPENEPARLLADETLHRRRIPRSFAIATKKITVAQYERFHPGYRHEYEIRYTPEEDCPIIDVTWFQAARYCRWLSEQEGIAEDQMCYPPIDQIKPGMILPADYLQRTGYRLPTEVEWEYACRAGAVTSRCYGTAEELLGNYGWYNRNSKNRTWPVGQLKPNDLGLFDAHGNTSDWCQERKAPYPLPPLGQAMEDEEERTLTVSESENRVIRGAAFDNFPSDLRSALRSSYRPTAAADDVGLRVARTNR